MFVAENMDQSFTGCFFLSTSLILQLLFAVLVVGRLNDSLRLDLLAGLAKFQRAHAPRMDPLEDSLVDELGWPDLRLVGHISLADLINVIKLLVEYLMHLDWVVLILVHLEDSVGQADGVLETRRG